MGGILPERAGEHSADRAPHHRACRGGRSRQGTRARRRTRGRPGPVALADPCGERRRGGVVPGDEGTTRRARHAPTVAEGAQRDHVRVEP